MTTKITVPSPAKINLFLHVNGQKDNGYHELQTAFQFLSLADQMSFQLTDKNEITLLTQIDGVNNDDNLIIRAANLLLPYKKITAGCNISIDKILPMGGGLGGGSSNAATTLLVLNKLWQLNLSTETLMSLGLTLGADVPIFIAGYAAIANGVGEDLDPICPIEPWYLITVPDVSISTAAIFSHPDLPRNTPKLPHENLDPLVNKNDCQNLVLKLYPKVANLMSWLVEYAPSKMTGTGACLFSQCESEAEAIELQKKLPQGIVSFVTKGCNKSPLNSFLNNLAM